MTYLLFLLIFLAAPIIALGFFKRRDLTRRRLIAVGAVAVIALAYTTPWDNHLVAERIWWYDPALVTGITFGWVPLEEYVFFVLQPILTGLWMFALADRLKLPEPPLENPARARHNAAIIAGLIWAGSILLLWSGWEPGRYLGLELSWAVFIIALQLAFAGGGILRRWRLIGLVIVSSTVYYALADSLAIASGTWTINPEFSLEAYIGGVLPLEELVFFFLTNTLIAFGVTLFTAPESRARLDELRARLTDLL
jgi:lycopene cyclase domain-containing protein